MRCKCHNFLKLHTYTHTQFSCDNLSVASVVILILTACILFLVPYHPATAQTVHIPDPGLRAVIESALGKEAGADITQSDMEILESLQANRCRFLTLSEKGWWTPVEERWVCESGDDQLISNIRNLSGIEFATNLKELELGRNQISDVTPLRNLTSLTHLSLGINRISNISALKSLTNLTHLSLIYNRISDISVLNNLTELRELDLDNNQILDLTPLKELKHLTHLSLKSNRITDLSPISNLTKLEYIFLRDNKISDLSPIRNITNLEYLNSGLNYKLTEISALKNLTKLKVLDLDDNQIADITPLKNMTDMRNLDVSSNRVSDVTPIKSMIKLTGLDLDSNGIYEINAIKDMTNLRYLDIHNNEILDVTPIKNMTRLTKLELQDNAISDLTQLKDLTNLTELYISGNHVRDITPIKNMTKLTALELDRNRISNVAPLKNLAKLTVLDLSHNHISDFSPITDLIDNLIEYDFSNQTEPPFSYADVNRDNTVNLADLVAIASNFADPDLEALARMNIYPDVNGDGLVNLIDLLIVASEIGADTAAPVFSKNQIEKSNLTAKDLAKWIQLAKQLDFAESNLQQGIDVLEQLLAILTPQDGLPKATALLPNYPNPFNPETWIPYQLAKPANVSVSIHSADGKLIRTLKLGQLPAGIYHNKSRAAYWNGRNALGESVASGVYFYTLTASDFTATGKMLIKK